ncbi:hypothetical protein HN51_066389, partial [Arachis hypogaea]
HPFCIQDQASDVGVLLANADGIFYSIKAGANNNLLVKDHTHNFVNKEEGGQIGELDFRFPMGAPLHGINSFLSTNQLKTYDKARNVVALALSPVVKALINS